MKKILSLMGVIGFVATGASSVISYTVVRPQASEKVNPVYARIIELSREELEELDDAFYDYLYENRSDRDFYYTRATILAYSDQTTGNLYNEDKLPWWVEEEAFNEVYSVILENTLVSIRLSEIKYGRVISPIQRDIRLGVTHLMEKDFVSSQNKQLSQNIVDHVAR